MQIGAATLAAAILPQQPGSGIDPLFGALDRVFEGISTIAQSFSFPDERKPLSCSTSGMELPPSRFSSQQPVNEAVNNSISPTASRHGPPHLPRDVRWAERSQPQSRQRAQMDRIELPSIRTLVPEIQNRGTLGQGQDYSLESDSISPGTALTTPDYDPSPSRKRRRLSDDERGYERRDFVAPRRNYSPPRNGLQSDVAAISPRSSGRRNSTFSMPESWPSSKRNSPYVPPRPLPSIRSPPQLESRYSEYRPTLPRLSNMALERPGGSPQAPAPTQKPPPPPPPSRSREGWAAYSPEAKRPQVLAPVAGPPFEARPPPPPPPPPSQHGHVSRPLPLESVAVYPATRPAQPQFAAGYGYTPPQSQSFSRPSISLSSAHAHSAHTMAAAPPPVNMERMSYPAANHYAPARQGPPFPGAGPSAYPEGYMQEMRGEGMSGPGDMAGYGPVGGGGGGVGGGKQRRRRGNLPRETTDKLRAWFLAHLNHPYPTEDEKQELIRQTGLQINQISNWFINARRRQLPAMINNARAESDAISGQTGPAVPGGAMNVRDRDDFHRQKSERNSVPLGSGDEDAEDDYPTSRRAKLKRGSI